MTHTLELYWDFSSPFAYLGSTQAEALAARTGATLIWRPMLLGAVFKAIGQADAPILTWSEQKRSYYFKDLARWAEHWGVPFRFPSRFPMMTVKALRAWHALPEPRQKPFLDAVFRAYWAEDRDIADDATLRAILGEGADEVLAKCATKEVKDALFASTQRAIDAGVFGAPAWVVDGKDLFWGQDRIVLVERALRAA
jgi:2-hydroxychromene-2-carboxylate isomerase